MSGEVTTRKKKKKTTTSGAVAASTRLDKEEEEVARYIHSINQSRDPFAGIKRDFNKY
jgi:hypothetical protein